MVFPIYNIHIDKGRKTREASRGRTRVANKTPEENRGWWWVQRRRERAERAARARASDSSGTKRVLKILDLRTSGTGMRATSLGSPHPTPTSCSSSGAPVGALLRLSQV